MELIAESNKIKLYLNVEHTNKVMDDYNVRMILNNLEEDMGSIYGGAFHNQGLVDGKIPFLFNGIYGHRFDSHEEARSFFDSVNSLVEETNKTDGMKISCIDDILFLLLTYAPKMGYVLGTRDHRKYMDELIEVFVGLRKRGVSWNFEEMSESERESLESIKFDDLPIAERTKLIDEEKANLDVRAIQPGNIDVYIPNDFDIVIKPRNGTKGKEVVLPEIFTSRLYKDLLKEIVEWHERYSTQFFEMLQTGEVNLHKLDSRTKYKNYKKLNEGLYKLILDLDTLLKETSTIETKDIERYAFIHDILIISGLLEKKEMTDKRGKFDRIRDIIRVNRPSTQKRGETQFFV